jgi:hypothetical protein
MKSISSMMKLSEARHVAITVAVRQASFCFYRFTKWVKTSGSGMGMS